MTADMVIRGCLRSGRGMDAHRPRTTATAARQVIAGSALSTGVHPHAT